MSRISGLLVASLTFACGRQPAGPAISRLSLDPVPPFPASLADPADPIGVTAAGVVVARLVLGSDSSYRLIDSTGSPRTRAAVSGVGAWLGGDDGLLYTLAPGAAGIATVRPDGSAGPSFRLPWHGVLRGVVGDSVDLMRLGANGFALIRVARAGVGDSGSGGERIVLPEGDSTAVGLLDVPSSGILDAGAGSPLPSTTTSADRIVVGNGQSYRIGIFSAAGQPIGKMSRDLDTTSRLTPRQVETEIRQVRRSGQQLSERYLELFRKQLSRQRMPFFSAAQGLRYDATGRLWVVGFEGDSVFADVFSDTTFLTRFSLGCYGFYGQWDLKGDWLAVACGHRDAAAPGGELQRYRIRGR